MSNTAGSILSRMMEGIPSKYNRKTGGYIHDVLAPVSIEFERAYSVIDSNMRKMFVATATGTDLDDVLSQFGYTRKAATHAGGYITVTGEEGAIIKEGDLVAKGKVVYVVMETAELVGGTATVEIEAQNPGSDGNADAGEVNYFPVTLSKITSVTNTEKITGGADEETDEAFRDRYYYFLDHPVTSGNEYEYEQWAREVSGVGLAKCYRIWAGPGTVKVVITSDTLGPADDTLVKTVYDYIESKRIVGASLTVESAETVEINVSATVVVSSGYAIESVKEQYETLLATYFKDVGFEGGLIPYTKLGSILQEIPGVEYYSDDFSVNGGKNNIIISDGQLAILGGVTLANG